MKARITAAVLMLIVVSVCSFVGFGRSTNAGDKPPAAPAVQEQDFGDKFLLLHVNANANLTNRTAVLVKAKVRRLGDRAYLVGQLPDQGEAGKGFNGIAVWLPVSEILQISEHESLAALNEYADAVAKVAEAKKQ